MIPLERAHALKEVGSGTQSMKQALQQIGYCGTVPASYKSMPIGVCNTLLIEKTRF